MLGLKIKHLLLSTCLIAVFVLLDQIAKYLAVLHLKNKAAIVILDGIFELHYLENRGAAFGLLANQRMFFLISSAVMLVAIVYLLVRLPVTKRYLPMAIFLILLAGGAIGNMIDRLLHGYVVDFFYFKWIDFPIFNVADIAITVGTILFAGCVLFVYQEEDFSFLKHPSKTTSRG